MTGFRYECMFGLKVLKRRLCACKTLKRAEYEHDQKETQEKSVHSLNISTPNILTPLFLLVVYFASMRKPGTFSWDFLK